MERRKVRLIKSQSESNREGTKSGFLAVLDGHIFRCTNSANTVTFGLRHYWKCTNCPARLITTDDDTVASVGTHLCERSEKEVSF